VPVVVNGTEISDRAIKAEVQYHPASSFEEAHQAAARALVIRELLLQAADQLGIADIEPVMDPQTGRRETREEALIRMVIEQEVKIPEPDEAACRRYYENNRRRFRTEDLLEAAHILFLADPQDEQATARAKEQASGALARVLEDPASFGALAGELSACPSAAQGGNLGQITRGQTVPEFETFLFNLEPGQICPVPVKTRFGYHVLRLDRQIEGHELSFEAVRDRIAAYLREHVWRRAVSQYLRLLIGQADIRGLELEGAKSLLVQ
jgi:peptidyl-prolyl cis-trans isomerase C